MKDVLEYLQYHHNLIFFETVGSETDLGKRAEILL